MKAIVLLVALLCQGGALALRCHNCTNLDGTTCSGPTECPRDSKACLSQTIRTDMTGQKLNVAFKSCVLSCDNPVPTKAKALITDMEFSLHCCSTDLCNGAGAGGPGAATVGLMLAATVLVTLPGAFL